MSKIIVIIILIGVSIRFYNIFWKPTKKIKNKIKKYNIKRGDVMFSIFKNAFEEPEILTSMITGIDFKRKMIQYIIIPEYDKIKDKEKYLSNIKNWEYLTEDFEILYDSDKLFKCDGIKSKYSLEYLLKHYDDFDENKVKRMIVNYL